MKKIFLITLILSVLVISCFSNSSSSNTKNRNHVQQEKEEAPQNNGGLYLTVVFGFVMGLISITIALFAYKTALTNTKQIKEIINTSILQDTIQNIIHKTLNKQQSSPINPPIEQIKKEVEKYINSEKFNEYIEGILKKSINTINQSSYQITTSLPNQGKTVEKSSYELYAKESTDNKELTDIQSAYQIGKSVYKLILEHPNSNMAQLSLCLEQEDAKRRILKGRDRYLEPICIVSLLSNDPTNVEVKSLGMAKRNGEKWEVIKRITVEIK